MIPAAILDFLVGVEQKFFHHFEAKSYSGKVTKAFPQIPNGSGAVVKRSVWEVNLPPPLYPMRVKANA